LNIPSIRGTAESGKLIFFSLFGELSFPRMVIQIDYSQASVPWKKLMCVLVTKS